jgi:hypothetical protein
MAAGVSTNAVPNANGSEDSAGVQDFSVAKRTDIDGYVGVVTHNRRAALDGLTRILEAGAPEELFTGPEPEALFIYDLLSDVTRGRSSTYYWEICRTARRRGVSPEYIVDRAAVLMTTIGERRRTDLYRILGVPALASAEMIRQRWLEVAKVHHPDVGGDGTFFRYAKQAYEVLRDPDRRGEYERFWLQALGPFERVAADDDVPSIEATPGGAAAVVMRAPTPAPPTDGIDGELGDLLGVVGRLFGARRALDQRVSPGRAGGLGALLARVEETFAAVRADELETLAADVNTAILELESLRADLTTLARLKQAVGA